MASTPGHPVTRPIWIPAKYQADDVEAFVQMEYGACFNDMGLGKTSTYLEVFRRLKEAGKVTNMLVVSSPKILSATWPDEIDKWENFHKLTWTYLGGEAKLSHAKQQVDIYLCPFDSLVWLPAIRDTFDMVLIDESSKIKDPTTFRTKASMYLGERAKYRFISSGTPAGENAASNLYAQIKFLDRGQALGDRLGTFNRRYMVQVDRTKWVPRSGAVQEIASRISHFVRRTTLEEAGIEMPPISYETLEVELPKAAMEKYEELEAEMFLQLAEGRDVLSANAAVLTNHCRQVANGAVYDAAHVPFEIHTAKLEALKKLYDEKVPLVICYEYQHDKARILGALGHHHPVIGGGMDAGEVRRVVKEWNAGKHRAILLHPKSAAYGLNLQEIPAHVVFFSNPWSLDENVQLVARVYRRGQRFPVRCTRIIAKGTIDEVIASRVGEKAENQEELFRLLRAYLTDRKGRS